MSAASRYLLLCPGNISSFRVEFSRHQHNYVNISSEDWTINSMIELFEIIRADYASEVSPIVEQITGYKPITFEKFAKDYAGAFR